MGKYKSRDEAEAYAQSKGLAVVQLNTKRGFPFLVDTAERICEYVIPRNIGCNRLYGLERREMLIMDIECYPPGVFLQQCKAVGFDIPYGAQYSYNNVVEGKTQQQYVDEFLMAVNVVCLEMVQFCQDFVSGEDFRKPNMNDFAIDESCSSMDGGKLSAHVVCPALVFRDIEIDMKLFMFYFICRLLCNQGK
jgi:hypothetical protein